MITVPFTKTKAAGWDSEEYRKRMEASIRNAWPGEAIDLEELIFHRASNEAGTAKNALTVFIDRALDLDWLVEPSPTSDVDGVLSKITATASTPCKHLPKTEQIAFRQMLGAAVICALSGNVIEAEAQRLEAKRFIENRITECSRLWSLTFAFLLLLCILITLRGANFLGEGQLSDRWSELPGTIFLGCLGAYVSIVYGSGKDRRDSSSGKALHLVEILAKYSVGAIAGVLCYFVLSSGLSPQFFREARLEPASIWVLGFIAGFSEKFIPRMVASYDKTKEN